MVTGRGFAINSAINGLFPVEGVDRVRGCAGRSVGRRRGLPRMGVLTLPIGRPRRARRYLCGLLRPGPDHVLPSRRARARGRRAATRPGSRGSALPGGRGGPVVSTLRVRGRAARFGGAAPGARTVGLATDDARGRGAPLSVHRVRARVAPGHQRGGRAPREALAPGAGLGVGGGRGRPPVGGTGRAGPGGRVGHRQRRRPR